MAGVRPVAAWGEAANRVQQVAALEEAASRVVSDSTDLKAGGLSQELA